MLQKTLETKKELRGHTQQESQPCQALCTACAMMCVDQRCVGHSPRKKNVDLCQIMLNNGHYLGHLTIILTAVHQYFILPNKIPIIIHFDLTILI